MKRGHELGPLSIAAALPSRCTHSHFMFPQARTAWLNTALKTGRRRFSSSATHESASIATARCMRPNMFPLREWGSSGAVEGRGEEGAVRIMHSDLLTFGSCRGQAAAAFVGSSFHRKLLATQGGGAVNQAQPARAPGRK